MNDLDDASLVLGIEIHQDRRKWGIRTIAKAYLEKILEKQSMHASKPTPAPIVKGNRFRNSKCSRNRYEIDLLNMVPYASAVGSLLSVQVQVRTYPDVV